jgi:hypothetical protein
MEIMASITKWITPKRLTRSTMNLLPNARVPTSSEELRDFGASKLILTVTRAFKVFALEATTSEIVWQKYLGGGAAPIPGMNCNKAAVWNSTEISGCGPWMQLIPHSAAPHSELLVVVPGTPFKIMWIEPLTGKVLHQEDGPSGGASIVSMMPLPRKGKQALSSVWPIIAYDSKQKVHTYPTSSEEASQIMEENADRLFHYEVDGVAQVVQGYAIGKKGAGHELVRLWNLELGSVGERLLAAGAPEHREWDHVPVHIKGDASILYKYINANLLAVVSEDIHSDNSTALNLYALDSVTGHVLQQSRIPGGTGPVHLVVCDNWIIMHYRNPKRTRFELFVMEFFQAKADDGPWDILFGGRQLGNTTKSAHHLETPVPLQQTYIFPSGVTSLGVTATLKGITPRSIIMALSTDHVFRVSKDVLNPRRPYADKSVGGDKEKGSLPAQFAPTKEEPIPPYSPLLPVRPTDMLSYYNPVGQVDGIVSSPTALESTSLVFCFGLDLFFIPVQTAKAYDVLSPGFNYLLLYASVGLVVSLWIVTAFVANRKALQDRWR